MRKTKKLNATNTNSNQESAEKIIRHPRRSVIVVSELLMAIMLLMACIPFANAYVRNEWNASIEAAAESARIEASANRQEHLCLQISVYWEMKRKRPQDAAGIAGNVMTRVDSPDYPDTVCEVVNEIRQHHKTGKDTAMYSYIFDGRYIPKYDDPQWVAAGIVAENVFEAYQTGGHYFRSVNYLTPEAAKKTPWARDWQKNCEIKPTHIEGAYHIFFDKLSKAERKACLANRKVAKPDAVAELILANTVVLPKKVPVPRPRPRA